MAHQTGLLDSALKSARARTFPSPKNLISLFADNDIEALVDRHV
jgi:hypothetical protein